MTRLVIVVSKVCSLCSKRTKGEKRKEEKHSYISAAKFEKVSSSFVSSHIRTGASSFHRPPAPFLLINTRSNRCFEPRQIGCTAPKEMLLQAAGKMKRRNSNKMPSGCKREMVSSDERLKEIRNPDKGERYCRVWEKRRVLRLQALKVLAVMINCRGRTFQAKRCAHRMLCCRLGKLCREVVKCGRLAS